MSVVLEFTMQSLRTTKYIPMAKKCYLSGIELKIELMEA